MNPEIECLVGRIVLHLSENGKERANIGAESVRVLKMLIGRQLSSLEDGRPWFAPVCHQISEEARCSRMTCSRVVNILIERNILDCKPAGKKEGGKRLLRFREPFLSEVIDL